ncbi:MAG: 3-carboxymuconate cyclase [Verrucomicrobia bacterium]|nr:MAG: 3-carboxymuconate cyclase [Verrucomicrobiota bacterium]
MRLPLKNINQGEKMHTQAKGIAIFASLLMLASLSNAAAQRPNPAPRPRPTPAPRNFQAGAVYVLTNQSDNAVMVFSRDAFGMLTPAGEFSTGGAGDPVPQGTDPPTDPLASQGALILDQSQQFLFAVNAGSNQISVLNISQSGLDLVDVVDSGGVRPISLTVHDNLLYVLNEGGTPNITGFTVGDDGTLTPLAGSTQPLIGGTAADPAQVSFNHDGTLLVVTEKAGNRIDTYTIDSNGLPSAPIDNPSNGMTPFGFAFNNPGFLVVSEAFGGSPNQSAASSYSAGDDGVLSVISGSVANSQTASCWVVITNNGHSAFVSNTGNGTISSYDITSNDGTLTLINSVAGDIGANSAPIDMALNVSSKFLYVLAGGLQSVVSFRVEQDGSLTLIDTDGGLPLGAQGIAAK